MNPPSSNSESQDYMGEAVEKAAEALMHGPPDPIRDEFGEGAVTSNPGIAVVGATRALRAALPVIRQAIEAELRERLLSPESKRAAAAKWDRAHAEKMATFMQSVRPGEVAQPFENSDIAGEALQAALDNTPTSEEGER